MKRSRKLRRRNFSMDDGAGLLLSADQLQKAENLRELAKIMETLEHSRLEEQAEEAGKILESYVANPVPKAGDRIVVRGLRRNEEHRIIQSGADFVRVNRLDENPENWRGWFITNGAPNGIYLGPENFKVTWVYPHTVHY